MRRSTRHHPVAAAAVALAILAACSSSGSEAATSGSSPSTVTPSTVTSSTVSPTTGDPAAPEQFGGPVADFYRVPDPLPKGPPGDLIRVQPVGTAAGTTTVRVMYHSRDSQDRDRAVTGTISYPTATAPKGGWPVISWAHGTTGLASQCAPSRAGVGGPGFGIEGVHVATDYIGMGPIGERLPYLSGPSEGHSVIDIVRAAVRLPAAHAGTRWLALGHSQGGHAALFTHQLGQAYAPELDLLGTVAIAPAAVLLRTFGPADQVVPKVVGLLALYGWEKEYPQIHADDYVGKAIRDAAATGVVDKGCLNDIITAFAGVPTADAYAHDPRTTEPLKSVLIANDPGHVKVAAPLLVVGGSSDSWVVPARVDALMTELCSAGQVTELVRVPGATHDSVVGLGGKAITAWLQARLAGSAPVDSCPGR